MIAETKQNTDGKTGAPPAEKEKILIGKVAVLGAGTMGSRIAAHIANAGLPVVLLDMVPKEAPEGDKAARSRLAREAVDKLKSGKPAAFFAQAAATLITAGNFEDDLALLRDCDWIIEAVSEDLEIKRSLLNRIEPFCRKDAIVTTNTSGLPVNVIAREMPEGFRRRWFGTHFFNPPRYMRLLEIIPTPETEPTAVAAIESFGDRRLGKTLVRSHDTPNFIANRIGTFAMLNAIRVMQAMDLTIEEVDALTGSVLGWPRTGTFRLADMVGIDVLGHVASNFSRAAKDERSDVTLPDFIGRMLERKWFGDKSGQGFYKKEKSAGGGELRLGLDWKTLEYRNSERAKFSSLEAVKSLEPLSERIKALLQPDPKKDRAAAFYAEVLPGLWNYAAHRIGEIADDVTEIDAAMRAGFNWELGPFQMWDAAGVPETVAKMRAARQTLAPAVERLLASGATSWYREDTSVPSGCLFFDLRTGAYQPLRLDPGLESVQIFKKSHGVVKKNPGASLVDLGDGVACLEFHSKMNAIGGDILSLVTQSLKPGGDAVRNFEAFVISGDAVNFSVGANLMQLLLSIQEQEWEDVDLMIRSFQAMTQAIKFCPRPVVAAPFGLCLGGGAEVVLHGAARQASAELYIGLVEVGVGLVPAGGGCKEMTLRAVDAAASIREGGRSESVELMEALRRNFESIAMAKVSTSARDARALGFLNASDRITMNRDRLLSDAKQRAREMAGLGYTPPPPRIDVAAPGENILATLRMAIHGMRDGEYISDHDVKVGNWVAHVLCGGKITPGTSVSEQYLLDLEREAFLSLCGEPKTAERIAYTLKNGKPLRN